jgi:peptide/nickel transport system permease protein
VLLFSAQNVTALAHTPWLLIPGLFILLIVIAFNFFGDGLRDAADPFSK